MKIKEEYVLQNIADRWVVIDTDSKSVNFNKILSLNVSGKFLWEKLEEGTDVEGLVNALIDQFGIDKTLAENDANAFVGKLKELGCVDDE